MLARGSEMFLFIPNDTNNRVLHPGRVVESNANSFVGEFAQPLRPEPLSAVNAYGDINGTFYQQPAIVADLRQALPTSIIAFDRAGPPVSAENREIFRVCVAMADINAKLESESCCPVMDISPVGLAALSAKEHKLGADVNVVFRYDGWAVSTTARVQTVKERPDGRFRYGLLALGKNTDAHRALQQMTMSMQHQQLRRLAGAA
jgi:hypothetical protein